jgi:hypothetical protein
MCLFSYTQFNKAMEKIEYNKIKHFIKRFFFNTLVITKTVKLDYFFFPMILHLKSNFAIASLDEASMAYAVRLLNQSRAG